VIAARRRRKLPLLQQKMAKFNASPKTNRKLATDLAVVQRRRSLSLNEFTKAKIAAGPCKIYRNAINVSRTCVAVKQVTIAQTVTVASCSVFAADSFKKKKNAEIQTFCRVRFKYI
jgi:hypothetical protein